MTLNHIFLGFMTLAGAATGALLVARPELREFRIPPYFWVLIAMAVFELAVVAYRRGTPGSFLGIEVRLLGFVLAIVLMVGIPIVAGSPGRLF